MAGKPQVCTHVGCVKATVARRLCRAHYQAAWKAGELGAYAKVATRPRLRDRKVCPPEHKHAGATTCFIQHQCRCDPCMDWNNERELRRQREIAYGRYDSGLVDVTRVREHVLMLSEYGIGYKRLAKLAGFRSSTPVRTIIWGRQEPGPRYGEMQKRIKRETAEKVLRVRPQIELLAGGQTIPSRGAQRRVQALVTRGWSMAKIAGRLGIDPTNFSGLMQRDRVLVSTHRAIAELYEELWDQAPPEVTQRDKIAASRARRYAEARGLVPPLAWDDIDMDHGPDLGVPGDDVAEVIDEVAVELASSGLRVRLSPAERRAAVQRLHADRMGDPAIADRLGLTDRTVLRIRAELGLQPWTLTEQRAGVHAPRAGRAA